ncbi:MAG TPA: iron-containing alcohol dehydrogenase [Candidatus Acidoferrales bacterium]|nr:iron-containing alcohol dehydrogenase [Candidatus Acidoferrales bacterium]
MANERSFLSPRVLFGNGVISGLPAELGRMGVKRALLLTTKMSRSTAPKRVIDMLSAAGIESVHFSAIEAEPSVASAEAAMETMSGSKADVVIGLGGGSALDVAKTVALASTNGGIRSVFGVNKAARPGTPHILIPTTSGTGSEATNVAVLTDQDKKKAVVYSDYLIPALALVDPELTYTMPREVTAHTGMDALTHSIEAYLSVNSSHMSDATALKAIELIANSLPAAYSSPTDQRARHDMSLAALLGGMSIANAGTRGDGCYLAGAGIAHAVGLATGTMYSLPHGLSVGMVLPAEMRLLESVSEARLAKISMALGGDGTRGSAVRIVESIMEQTAIDRKLGRDAGGNIDAIIDGSMMAKRLLLNMPMEITREHMRTVVSAIV